MSDGEAARSGQPRDAARGLVDPEAAALVRAFGRRTPRRPPLSAQASRDPMFRRAGSSFDLKNIREYQSTDDPRRIEWKLEGRTDRLFVKEYYDEERDGAAVLVDLSASLGVYGAAEAKRVGATIAWMLGALGVPTSLEAFAGRTLRRLSRQRGGKSTAPIASFFAGLEPEGRTDISAAVASARAASRYRRLVLVSDFFDRDWSPRSSPFARNCFVRLYRPFSDLRPGRAEVDVEDPETGRRLRLPWDAAAEAAYARREAELDAAFREAARRGAYYGILRPGEPRRTLYWSLLKALYA